MENDKFEYVFENSDFLVTDADQEHLSTDDNQYGEIVYASESGSQTILLHNGEYYIQTDGETLLLGNGPEDIDQLVINENSESEQSFHVQSEDDNVIQYLKGGDSCEPVIYKFIQNEEVFNPCEEVDAEPLQKKIKVENYLVELDEAESVSFDVEKHLRVLEEQEGLNSSRFQYAVIKDGKLHLQLCDTDSIEVLKGIVENENSSQASLELQDLCTPMLETTTNIVDVSKVTGRNLITGQTVTLDDYLERIHNKITLSELEVKNIPSGNTFLNRKFTIGRTMAGKKLVGKILQIKTGLQSSADDENEKEELELKEFESSTITENSCEPEDNASELIEVAGANPASEDDASLRECNETENATPAEVNIQELIFDSTGKVLKVSNAHETQFNEAVTTDHLQFLSKTLSGLADMDSLRKKILDRELHIKFVEKQFENKTQEFRKTVMHLKGHLVLQEQDDSATQLKNEYVFVMNGDKFAEEAENAEATKHHQKKRSDDWTSLTVVITQDRTGHKTTRVNFYEKADSSTACKLCNREFKSVGHLNRHLSTSHSDKTLTCHICQIKFGDHALLNKHRRHHEHYFVCATCGKSFTTQSSLRRHLSVHDHSLRPLECTICNARFTDESSLCKHLIIHTGIKAYHCNVCQKAFTTVGDLNFHKRVHDPVKLFYCEVCGREFSRHSNLLRHIEIHKGSGELYKCGVCGCSYKFISSLTRHVVQNHMSTT